MDDAQLLARAGEQAPRSVTQIRANEGWLSDNDTLRVFMENFGNGSGYGAGAGSFGRGEAGLSLPPDKGVPVIEIHPPVLGMDQSIAVGFALRKAPAAQP
jgi:hypothetical protein